WGGRPARAPGALRGPRAREGSRETPDRGERRRRDGLRLRGLVPRARAGAGRDRGRDRRVGAGSAGDRERTLAPRRGTLGGNRSTVRGCERPKDRLLWVGACE